jgi:putative transcriptional regulator
MEHSLAGRLLVATPQLGDPNFARTVVLIIQHDDEGALGVVLNRPSAARVIDHLPTLEPWVVEPAVVFVGGPVEPEVGIGLERAEGDHVPLFGVRMLDLTVPETVAAPCRVFSGYAGWSGDQLEEELGEGAWFTFDGSADDVFAHTPDELWSRVLRRQGGRFALLSTLPPHPELN